MTVADAIPDWERWDIRILATDLDTDVLAHCEAGVLQGGSRRAACRRARLDKYFDARRRRRRACATG